VSVIVDNLNVTYGSVRAARSISFVCDPGQVITIVGPNGAGKSSVLLAIAGASSGRTTGRVTVDETDILGMEPEGIVRLGVALVPEGRRIFNSLSVRENLQLGTVLRRDRREAAADIEAMFERFPALAQRREAAGGTLSGGEAQQLAIARSLLSRPRYLLLDEPSLGLAPLIVKQIFNVISDLNKTAGLTVFLVEQNAFHALKLAHRGYVMVNGQITMQGTGAELLARPEVRAAYLEGGH
jgi:branched-chain amino acid transport system ATP-binding protein